MYTPGKIKQASGILHEIGNGKRLNFESEPAISAFNQTSPLKSP